MTTTSRHTDPISRFTVSTGPTGRDENHYDGFADALGELAIHAESGRRARIYALGGLTLAYTTGDHTITLAGKDDR